MPRHQNKHIDKAVQYAESLGWRVELSKGHPWAILYCPENSREGCHFSVWSTPQNPEKHAKQIQKKIEKCVHTIFPNEDE